MDGWTIFLGLTGLVLVAGAIAPTFTMKTWWVRNWVYARQQIFWLLLVNFLLFVWLTGLDAAVEGGVAAILLAGLFYCARTLWPYLPFSKTESQSAGQEGMEGARFSLLLANVLQDNTDYDALLAVIEGADPDIIFLSETSEDWVEGLSSLASAYEHTRLLPGEDYNGICIYSRFPILEGETRCLVQDHVPSFKIDFEIGAGMPLRLYAIHPRPPRPEDDADDLDQELRIIAHEAYASEIPVIVAGDLNEVGWSRALERFRVTSGLRDPQRGRGIYNTYNAKIPGLRWPLDHAFHSEDVYLARIQRLASFGSDHFPMFYEFVLPLGDEG